MTEWMATIVNTPYLLVPIVAWLWNQAKFPKMDWGKLAAGVLFTFSGAIFNTLANSFAPYVISPWGAFFLSLFSFFGTISEVLGLAIIALYILVDTLKMWSL
ncbi:MAG: hypothetical protein GOU99_00550 [Candidatus Altiarchaeota archaeon]|nr:hypothetical protein [Candidatus Altiarchaeota archaeon]